MKRLFALLLIAAIIPAFAQDKVSKGAKTAATDPVLEACKAQLKAWSAKDVKAASAFYAKDAGLAFFDISPLKYNGWAEYEKGVAAVLAEHKSLSLTANPDLKVHHAGNLVWVTGTIHAILVTVKDKRMEGDARWTTLWENRGGKWLIVHEHISFPAP